MFLARCIVALAGPVLERWMLPLKFRSKLNYDACKEEVVEWHKSELTRLNDPEFRLRQVLSRNKSARGKLASQP